jgi:DedD protein
MDNENVKSKERIELSLDGRQIASIVVGALVLLGVVFVLGLNLGRQLATRQLEATRGDALAALDRPPPAPAAPISDDALTFHDRLTKDRAPPVEEPPARPPPGPAPAAPATTPVAATAAAAAPAPPAATGAFAVQLVSTTSRAEADKLAGKLQEFGPRVEAAEVSGKGRVYRVRVGSFETRAEAEKMLKTLAPRAGGKGMVVPIRAR